MMNIDGGGGGQFLDFLGHRAHGEDPLVPH